MVKRRTYKKKTQKRKAYKKKVKRRSKTQRKTRRKQRRNRKQRAGAYRPDLNQTVSLGKPVISPYYRCYNPVSSNYNIRGGGGCGCNRKINYELL